MKTVTTSMLLCSTNWSNKIFAFDSGVSDCVCEACRVYSKLLRGSYLLSCLWLSPTRKGRLDYMLSGMYLPMWERYAWALDFKWMSWDDLTICKTWDGLYVLCSVCLFVLSRQSPILFLKAPKTIELCAITLSSNWDSPLRFLRMVEWKKRCLFSYFVCSLWLVPIELL